jgi:hypothetical protein
MLPGKPGSRADLFIGRELKIENSPEKGSFGWHRNRSFK